MKRSAPPTAARQVQAAVRAVQECREVLHDARWLLGKALGDPDDGSLTEAERGRAREVEAALHELLRVLWT